MQCHAKISSISNYESSIAPKNGPLFKDILRNIFFIPNFDFQLYPCDKCTELVAFPKKINIIDNSYVITLCLTFLKKENIGNIMFTLHKHYLFYIFRLGNLNNS